MNYDTIRQHSSKIILFICIELMIIILYESYELGLPSLMKPNSLIQSNDLPWWDGGSCDDFNNITKFTFPPEVSGTCGQRSWALGAGQKVISYALFGTDPEYWTSFYIILDAAEKLYPEYVVRIYTNPHKNPHGRNKVLCGLLNTYKNLHICDVTNLPSPLGNVTTMFKMLWRSLPMLDPMVDVFLSRDADSQLFERGQKAVQEWLTLNTTFHIMRDHPYHVDAINGGLHGIRANESNRKLLHQIGREIVHKGKLGGGHNYDQNLLSQIMWKKLLNDMTSHDSFGCTVFPNTRPYPTKRPSSMEFLGAAKYRVQFTKDVITWECPKACRPKEHQDWLYC